MEAVNIVSTTKKPRLVLKKRKDTHVGDVDLAASTAGAAATTHHSSSSIAAAATTVTTLHAAAEAAAAAASGSTSGLRVTESRFGLTILSLSSALLAS